MNSVQFLPQPWVYFTEGLRLTAGMTRNRNELKLGHSAWTRMKFGSFSVLFSVTGRSGNVHNLDLLVVLVSFINLQGIKGFSKDKDSLFVKTPCLRSGC